MKRCFLIAAAALFVQSCSDKTNTAATTAALPEGKIDPATAGTISGRVLFDGPVPTMQPIDMSSNPTCERQHKGKVTAQTIVINTNRTLRFAFVRIKSGLPNAHWTPPAEAVVLTQSGCIYAPHVVGLMTGQLLEIVNDDPVNHNIHAESKVNQAWNIAEAPRDEHKYRKFSDEEIFFPITCSVHPWMRAFAAVSSHPFFAVTGDDGAFTISGVPPGNYTIEVVQEKLGKKEAPVTVAPHGAATIDFTYGS